MSLNFHFLADYPEQTHMVVQWWSSVWAKQMGDDLQRFETQLLASLSNSELPLLIVANLEGIPVGTAALKAHELSSVYPNFEYWLGSVFVLKDYRGAGIASKLSLEIVRLAKRQGLPHLYLQTQNLNGGLYKKLGWKSIEQFSHDSESGLLMMKHLN